MTYRVAVIGCGMIGSEFADDPRIKGVYSHAGAYAACPATELVAVCDIDRAKAHCCGKRWGIDGVYEDIVPLLEEQKPEFVSICTPDATHADILNVILSAPQLRAVLAEKPLAMDVNEARKLAQLAADRGILLAVNYSRRYSTGHAKIRELLRSGSIGTIQKVSGYYTKGVLHNGSHWFDLARWLIGEVTAVRGFPDGGELCTDPTLDVWMTFDNGAFGFLQGCRAEAFSIFEMDIVGTRGRIRLTDSGHRVEIFDVAESPYYSGYTSLHKNREEDGEMEDTLLHAVQDLVDCLEHGGVPRCSGFDGVAALQIASEAVLSAYDGAQHHLAGREHN